MSEYTAGVLKIRTDVEGDKTPAQLEKLGKQYEKAGDKAGDGFAKNVEKNIGRSTERVGKDMEKGFAKTGQVSGERFSTSLEKATASGLKNTQANLAKALSSDEEFAKYAKNFNSGKEAQDALGASLDSLTGKTIKYTDAQGNLREGSRFARGEHTKIRNDILKMGAAYDVAAEKTRAYAAEVKKNADAEEAASKRRDKGFLAIEKLAGIFDKTRGSNNRFSKSLRSTGGVFDYVEGKVDGLTGAISKPWKNLDNDVKLVIGLIASAGDQIAVLGSAIGGGLFAIGGAAAAAGVGLVGVLTVFKKLNQDIDTLPEGMRGVAGEFQNLKGSFSTFANAIAGSAFHELQGSFTSLQGTVKALTPAFALVGQAVGKMGAKLASALGPNTVAFKDLNNLIIDSVPIFESLAGSAGVALGAIVKGLGKASPLTEQFVGWVKRLVDQFATFVNSNGFDDWIAQTSTTWSKFGALLDAVGRSLNNLSNPASVERTHDLLDGLTAFIPTLEKLLTIFGNTNIIGLFVQALVSLGDAFDPLLDALVVLSEALGEALMPIVESMAKSFAGLAIALTPVAYAAAAFIDALPPPVLEAIGVALGGVVTAMIALKAASEVMTAFSALQKTLTPLIGKLGGMSGVLGTLGKAGLWGAIAAGAVAAGLAIDDMYKKFRGFDKIAQEAVSSGASIKSVWGELGTSAFGVSNALTDIDGALANQKNVGTGFMDTWGNIVATFDDVGRQSVQLAKVMGDLDKPLATTAKVNLPAAQAQFKAYAKELGATEDQYGQLLETTPEYAAVLNELATQADGTATEQEVLALAVGKVDSASAAAKEITLENANALAELYGKSNAAGDSIDGLSDKIRNFGSATLEVHETERAFQQAVDDLTASVEKNGTTLDTTTEAGRENQAALDDIAKSSFDLAAATYEQTGSLEGATGAINTGRDALVNQMKQMGYSEEAANQYADELGLIPGNIGTLVELNGVDQAVTDADKVKAHIDSINDKYVTIHVKTDGSGITTKGGMTAGYASGGVVSGAQHALVGEAGPEAIVPLNRALSRVDPSVRWLSALAQGKKPTQAMASGGVIGTGRTLNINPGAIIIQGGPDPRRTAQEVVNRITEKAVG